MKKLGQLAKNVAKATSPEVGLRKRSGVDVRELKELVGEVRSEDGIDPRYQSKRRNPGANDAEPGLTHAIHQQERFTAQVQLEIESALQTASSSVLNSLTVREVAKQGSSLLVVVGPRNPEEPLDLKAATKALKQASSMLRREVAAAITRKDFPNLSFVVLPADAEKADL